MKSTATITMATPVLEKLRGVAKSEKRSLSQQIELLVERHFSTTGPTGPKRALRGHNRKKGTAA